MHFCTPLVIGNIIGNHVTGGLVACPGLTSHRFALLSSFLFYQQWRVLVYLCGENLAQESRLQLQTVSIRRFISEEWMGYFFVQPLLKLGEEHLASFVFEPI